MALILPPVSLASLYPCIYIPLFLSPVCWMLYPVSWMQPSGWRSVAPKAPKLPSNLQFPGILGREPFSKEINDFNKETKLWRSGWRSVAPKVPFLPPTWQFPGILGKEPFSKEVNDFNKETRIHAPPQSAQVMVPPRVPEWCLPGCQNSASRGA